MPDLTTLQAALKKAQPEPAPLVAPDAAAARDEKLPRCRQGRDHVGVWLPRDVRQSLKLVAVREHRTVQSLMEEAVDELLRTRGISTL